MVKLIDGIALTDRLLADAITTDQRTQANYLSCSRDRIFPQCKSIMGFLPELRQL